MVVAVNGSVTLPTSSQDARFDLIGVDQSGAVVFVQGLRLWFHHT